MRIESLEEFCVLSKLLNYTKASAELHESQSTLSRHIRGMEIELGFPLIGNVSNQLFVTKEGKVFLNGIFPMVEEYHALVKKCRDVRDSLASEFTIQEPPYQDVASIAFLRSVARFKLENPETFVRYKSLHADIEVALKDRSLDVALDYRFGDLEAIKAEYQEASLEPVLICEVPLMVCCKATAELAQRESLCLKDIANWSIMSMYDISSPTRRAMDEMLATLETQPRMINCAVSSLFEFFMAPMPDDGIYIIPAGLDQGSQLVSREGLKFVPLKDVTLHFFAIFRSDYVSAPDLAQFRSCLENAEQ